MSYIDPISAVGADPIQPLVPSTAPSPSDPAAPANASDEPSETNAASDTTTVVNNPDGTVTTTIKDSAGDVLSVITTGIPTTIISDAEAASESASRLNITI